VIQQGTPAATAVSAAFFHSALANLIRIPAPLVVNRSLRSFSLSLSVLVPSVARARIIVTSTPYPETAACTALFLRRGLSPFFSLELLLYFCNYRNMPNAVTYVASSEQVLKYAEMFSAMGTEARLRIMQLLLTAHPEGLVAGEIQQELDIPASTLSHHLDKLKAEDLVRVRREGTFLHYTANTDALRELLQFLYAECCTRNKAVQPKSVVQICK